MAKVDNFNRSSRDLETITADLETKTADLETMICFPTLAPFDAPCMKVFDMHVCIPLYL